MLLVCPSCGTKNRVPDERLGDEPVCGRCGVALMGSESIPLDDRSTTARCPVSPKAADRCWSTFGPRGVGQSLPGS